MWKFLKPVSFALIGKEINFNVLQGHVIGYGALLVLVGSLVIKMVAGRVAGGATNACSGHLFNFFLALRPVGAGNTARSPRCWAPHPFISILVGMETKWRFRLGVVGELKWKCSGTAMQMLPASTQKMQKKRNGGRKKHLEMTTFLFLFSVSPGFCIFIHIWRKSVEKGTCLHYNFRFSQSNCPSKFPVPRVMLLRFPFPFPIPNPSPLLPYQPVFISHFPFVVSRPGGAFYFIAGHFTRLPRADWPSSWLSCLSWSSWPLWLFWPGVFPMLKLYTYLQVMFSWPETESESESSQDLLMLLLLRLQLACQPFVCSLTASEHFVYVAWAGECASVVYRNLNVTLAYLLRPKNPEEDNQKKKPGRRSHVCVRLTLP